MSSPAPPPGSLLTSTAPVSALIGVFSTGEVLHRIGYSLTLTGTLEPRA